MPQRLDIATKDSRRLIGRRIRRRRLALRLSQARFAEAIGVTPQQAQNYESGLVAISPQRIREILQVLGLEPDDLSIDRTAIRAADSYENFLASAEAVSLHRALSAITDPAARQRLIRAVMIVGESQRRPAGKEDPLLSQWLSQAVDGALSARADEAAAAIRELRIELARRIGAILKARPLTQKHAAQLLGVHQARISALMRGDVRSLSLEKLLRHLSTLGWNVTVAIRGNGVEQPVNIALRFDPE